MLAFVGFQLFTVMVSVSGTVPVFLIHKVCVVVPPGFIVPLFRVVAGIVQALSVYTPRFTAAIVPLYGTVWFAVSAARVVTVRNIPIVARAIIDSFAPFWNAIGFTPLPQ